MGTFSGFKLIFFRFQELCHFLRIFLAMFGNSFSFFFNSNLIMTQLLKKEIFFAGNQFLLFLRLDSILEGLLEPEAQIESNTSYLL